MLTRCLCLLLTCLWLSAGASAQTPTPPPADVRLLVDVSGSMARTDPDNLRRPALSLLVRLLPSDSRAGVWTFGSDVDALVPHRVVDSSWKTRSLEAVDEIGSPALYTHVGAALEAAAHDREALAASGGRADIILLTDGMVDVSPDPGVSAREQRRIIDTLMPELRAAGYRVHTIGLSDSADEPFLRQLARQSDGMFSRARSAEQLMDSFLQIFQQTVPADQLPISGGLFLIDDSVQEFTALIRREPGQSDTVLTDPRGQRYRAESVIPGVTWHHTEDYDLVTVTDPPAGRWEINAALQPYSRLTVISNLSLVVEPLPNNIAVGEAMTLRFHLRSDNGVVRNPALLTLVEAVADVYGPDGEIVAREPAGAPTAEGLFELSLPAPERPGEHRVRLLVDGQSFQRLYTHRWAAASQFEVRFGKHLDGQQTVWRLEIDGKDTVNPAQTDIVAHVRHSGGFSAVEVLESPAPGLWRYEVVPEQPATYRISLRASGQTRDGRPFEEHLPSQYFRYPQEGDPRPDPTGEAIQALEDELKSRQGDIERARAGEDTEAPTPTTVLGEVPEEPEPAPQPAVTVEPREPTHPAVLVGSLVLANGLLLGLAFVAYRWLVGAGKQDDLPDEEVEDAETETASEPPAMQSIETELELDPEPSSEEGSPFDLAEEEPTFPDTDDDKGGTRG